MNRNMIIGGVIVIALAVGGWFAFGGSDDDTTTDTTDSISTTDDEGNPSLPNSVYNGPYKLEMTTEDTTNDSLESNVTISYISDNLWSIDTESSSGGSSIIYSGDYSYVGSDNSGWIRYPADSSSGSSLAAYAFTSEDLAAYEAAGFGYQSSESCALGTCAVWTGSYAGTSSTIRIATNGRIDSMESTIGTSKTVMQYSYPSDLNIDVPTEFTDLSSFGTTD